MDHSSPDKITVLYRFDGGMIDNRLEVVEFQVLRETPKGYWINLAYGGYMMKSEKWVSKISRKRFAYPTKDEALDSFIARKKKQIQILKYQLGKAQDYYKQANRHKAGEPLASSELEWLHNNV